jgi:hypothetical protein
LFGVERAKRQIERKQKEWIKSSLIGMLSPYTSERQLSRKSLMTRKASSAAVDLGSLFAEAVVPALAGLSGKIPDKGIDKTKLFG